MWSMKKCLFLDIDGVLNRAEYGKELYGETYSDYCLCLHRPSVEALKKLLDDEPDLKIVWISDWAKFDSASYYGSACQLDPLVALEQFPWLKERVFGSVFYGAYETAKGDEKMHAVKAFVEDHIVESYAILDDDAYAKADGLQEVFNHLVSINPLKSFLEDDLPLVKSKLEIPMDRETIHKTLLSLDYEDSFVVNQRYRCSFDFSKYHDKAAPLFSEFKKDENCPRLTAEVDVLVYDMANGEHLQGLVALNIDKDLGNKKEASLCVKHLGDSNWMSGLTVIYLTDVMRLKR